MLESPDTPSPLAREEYRALRATIGHRGTVRVAVVAATFVAWASLALASLALFQLPVITLFPLIVLAAGFEVVFTLHVGVERIGRYLQTYYETVPGATPLWEHLAMQPRPATSAPSSGLDPLFAGLFIAAALLNVVPVALLSAGEGPLWLGLPVELAVYGLCHLVFVLRVIQARRYSAAQRRQDLDFFEASRQR